MDKYDVLILDVYNMFCRFTFFQEESLIKMDGTTIHTEGIVGFFNGVDAYIKRYANENTKIYFLFDNAKSYYHRKQMYEAYKEERALPEWYYRELDYCELIAHYYRDNSYLFRVPNFEADDFVGNILRSYVKDTDKVLMISDDLDWCRFLKESNPMVNQYKNREILTVETFEMLENFYPSESNITFYKTFYGDKSDNIVGCLKNLPFNYFMNIILNYTDLDSFIKDSLEGKLDYLDGGWKLKIQKEKDNMAMNWDLITPAEIDDVELSTYKYTCSYKPNKLKILYSSLNLLGKMDSRIKGYESNHSIFEMLEGEDISRK